MFLVCHRVYPQWKEKVLAYEEIKKQQAKADLEKYQAAARALQEGSAMPGTGFPVTSTPVAPRHQPNRDPFFAEPEPSLVVANQQQLQQQLLDQQLQLKQLQLQQQLYQQQPLQQRPSDPQQHQPTPLQQQMSWQQQQPQSVPQQQQQAGDIPEASGLAPAGLGGTLGLTAGSTIQTVSDLPTGYSLSSYMPKAFEKQSEPLGTTTFSTEVTTKARESENQPGPPDPFAQRATGGIYDGHLQDKPTDALKESSSWKSDDETTPKRKEGE